MKKISIHRATSALASVSVALALSASLQAQPLPSATPESVGVSSERLGRIRVAMDNYIEEGRMPGGVLAIARHGKLIYHESFGYLDIEAGIEMPLDAVFSIASLTKPIVSVAALTLFERGELLLNEPVDTYLPELREMKVAVDLDPSQLVPARRQPSIQDLFRHTAGFTHSSQGNTELHQLFPSGDWLERLTGADLIQALSELPLHHQPGTTWDYGYGFDMLGVIIERISGKSHGEFLQETIFEPLGMKDTSFRISEEMAPRFVMPLPKDPVTGAPQQQRNHNGFTIECGGGCLASTALDYLAFAQMLLDGGELNGTRILGPKTVEYMTADHADPEIDLSRLHYYPSLADDGYGFGLGVAVRRGDGLGGTIGSAGQYHWYGASGTLFRVDPEQGLVIVFMAHTPGEIRRLNRQLVPALVYQALME